MLDKKQKILFKDLFNTRFNNYFNSIQCRTTALISNIQCLFTDCLINGYKSYSKLLRFFSHLKSEKNGFFWFPKVFLWTLI